MKYWEYIQLVIVGLIVWIVTISYLILSNDWAFVNGALQPLWYEGASLTIDEIDDNLTDDDDNVVSDNESESDKQTF